MQTFLTDIDYIQSASSLDNGRLNKQITEVWQICLTINDSERGWQNHPAVNMWRDYKDSLLVYGLCCYSEWQYRYGVNKRKGKLLHKAGEKIILNIKEMFPEKPDWLNEKFCSIHRSVLLAKAEEDGIDMIKWYNQFDWKEKPAKRVVSKNKKGSWPYIWPKK